MVCAVAKKTLQILLLLTISGLCFTQEINLGGTDNIMSLGPLFAKECLKAGYKVQITWLPLIRLQEEMKADRIDGAFLLSDAEISKIEGAKKLPVVLYTIEFIAVTADPSIVISRPEDVGKWRVAYTRGTAFFENLAQKFPRVTDVTNAAEMYSMLEKGRVDVVLSNRGVFTMLAPRVNVKLYPQNPPLGSAPLYLILSSRLKNLIPGLSDTFARDVASGEWTKQFEEALRTPVQAAPPPNPQASAIQTSHQ